MKTARPDDDDLAAILRALGHPVRLEILRILVDRSGLCCCTEVTGCLALAQSTVSQHLKVLLDAGIIERQPVGTRNQYAVRAERLKAFCGALEGFVSRLDALETDPTPA